MWNARKLYQQAEVIFSAGDKASVVGYMHENEWRYRSGGYTSLLKGPVHYCCGYTECSAICRVVCKDGLLVVQTPAGQLHSIHDCAGVSKRADSIFPTNLEAEVRHLLDSGATPTAVANTLRMSNRDSIMHMVPRDLSTDDINRWNRNHKHVAYKLANLNELTAWMQGR